MSADHHRPAPRCGRRRRRPLRLSWADERVRGIVWQVLVVVGDRRRHRLVALEQHGPQSGGPAHRHRLRLPEPRGRAADRRVPDRLQPDRHLSAGADRRAAEHAEGRGGRHRPGDHARHPGRHRPAVAELAAVQDRRRLCRGDARPAAAAAAAVLVRDPAEPARAAPGAEPGRRACSSPTAASSCPGSNGRTAHGWALLALRRRRRRHSGLARGVAMRPAHAGRPAAPRSGRWRSG